MNFDQLSTPITAGRSEHGQYTVNVAQAIKLTFHWTWAGLVASLHCTVAQSDYLIRRLRCLLIGVASELDLPIFK